MGRPIDDSEHRLAGPNKGFTLIEVLIVLVIVGILASLAVVKFDTYREQAKLRSSAQKVYQILSWARLQSEKKSDSLLVQFAMPRLSVYHDKNGSGTIDPNDTLILRDSVENSVGLFSAAIAGPLDASGAPGTGLSDGAGTCGPNVCCDKTGGLNSPTWKNALVAVCARTLPAMPSVLEDGALYLGSTNSGVLEKWVIVMNRLKSQNPSLWTSQKAPTQASDWRRVR